MDHISVSMAKTSNMAKPSVNTGNTLCYTIGRCVSHMNRGNYMFFPHKGEMQRGIEQISICEKRGNHDYI